MEPSYTSGAFGEPSAAASSPPPNSSYVQPQVVAPARPSAPARRRGGWLGCLLSLGGLAAVLVLAGQLARLVGDVDTDHKLHEKYHSLARRGQKKVAIIRIEGAIMDGEGFVKDQIDQAAKDDAVQAVVLRVDSPGGTVTGSDYLYHHLTKLVDEHELPMVVSMGGLAASGGYYVAMAVGDQANSIFAEPTTWTGSIGVIIPHYNVAGLMTKWEVEDDSIKSHPLKGIGTPTKKLTEEERTILQNLVDEMFGRFKEIVQSGRPRFKEHPEELDAVATGQVFTTQQALTNGLVDKQGFIEDAILRAIELASLQDEHERDNVKVIEYEQELGLMDALLFGAQGAARRRSELATVLDLLTPRAYYLMSWLPTVDLNGQ